ncbi:MAG: hypothetical protein KDE53_34415 [Caldilineaceae bacterium]|nr:hypothetical protein [Caldilineaceae bacterium]MCB0128628.1 hypothetical protein [Caldilineaceae bacterium]
MTLTITLDLTPAEEQQLQKEIAEENKEEIRHLLLRALEPTVYKLLSQPIQVGKAKEFEELTAQLHKIVAEALPDDFTGLSDYAISREGIYADHP